MKLLLKIFLMLTITSCATQSYHIEELSDYSYKHYEEIQVYVNNLIDNHKDYSVEQKKDLKKVLKKSLDKSREIKIQESKTAQLLLDSLIAENADLAKINKLKKEMTFLYDKKEELFLDTANQIKKIVGIKQTNHVLTMEISPFMQ